MNKNIHNDTRCSHSKVTILYIEHNQLDLSVLSEQCNTMHAMCVCVCVCVGGGAVVTSTNGMFLNPDGILLEK